MCAIIAAGSPTERKPQYVFHRGVAPDAQVICYRIADGDDDGVSCTNEAVLKAPDIIIVKIRGNQKIDVFSISYDLAKDDDNMVNIGQKITRLTEMGVVIVAGAGNRGGYQVDVATPACFDNVISVGSLDRYGRPSKFSPPNTDVSAPGELNLPEPDNLGDIFCNSCY